MKTIFLSIKRLLQGIISSGCFLWWYRGWRFLKYKWYNLSILKEWHEIIFKMNAFVFKGLEIMHQLRIRADIETNYREWSYPSVKTKNVKIFFYFIFLFHTGVKIFQTLYLIFNNLISQRAKIYHFTTSNVKEVGITLQTIKFLQILKDVFIS